MNGFDKRREKKKKQIISSLTELMMKKNFKKIGIRELAEHASVSPASIYNFFGSKEKLAKLVFQQLFDDASEEFIIAINGDHSFSEKVTMLFKMSNKNQEALNSEGLKNFMFEDPAFIAHINEYMEQVAMPLFMKLIEQGKAEGAISEAISERAIMMYYHSLIGAYSDPALRENMDVQLRKEMAQMFMYGVFGNKQEEE